MIEAEWLACENPGTMAHFVQLQHQAKDRKLRLFAVSRCRHFWTELVNEAQHRAVETAELYADGLAQVDDLIAADDALRKENRAAFAHSAWVREGFVSFACQPPGGDICGKMFAFRPPYPHHDADIMRDIFGNPFRPVTFYPAWLTSTVVAIARGVYESRDFSAMPILADALQDAGCDNDEVLAHCRGPGPHVRGCFVVDLLLGKA